MRSGMAIAVVDFEGKTMKIIEAMEKAKQRAELAISNSLILNLFSHKFTAGYVAYFRGVSKDDLNVAVGWTVDKMYSASERAAAELGWDMAREDAMEALEGVLDD